MKHLHTKVLLGTMAVLSLASCGKTNAEPVNIALGKSVTYSASPNYKYSNDPNDAIQLTDGKYSSGDNVKKVENTRAIWVQKNTVGWNNRSPLIITIDLGKVQPISGTSFSTAAGTSGVFWPTSIQMAVSTDKKTWHYAGNLINLSRKNGTPPAKGYAAFRYVTQDLHTKGRYIQFGVGSTGFLFCDEIEVYRGNDAWLSQPVAGNVITSMKSFVPKMKITSAAQRRIYDDINDIQRAIEASPLSAAQKSTFKADLQKKAKAATQMKTLPKDFETIVPINDIHRDVLAVRGQFLKEQGYQPITLWQKHRYAWLPLLARPQKQSDVELHFTMLRDQYRSDSFLATNATGNKKHLTLRLSDAPQDAKKGWLKVYSVAWTDTAQGIPVADALFPVQPQNGVYTIDIPAGISRKIWFTVDSSKLRSGEYKSTFVVKSGNQQFPVPVHLDVAELAMQKPRLSLGMWDYSNNAYYAINDENRQEAIALMRSHYVDSPWASRGVLPWPKASDFDAQGNYTASPDFSRFDQWISWWPDVKHYFVYASVNNNFAGSKAGTPEFDAKVESWAKVLSAHMKDLGLEPQQLALLLVDEPHTANQASLLTAWSQPINKAAPELTLFNDPAWDRPDKVKNQLSITINDIVCPPMSKYLEGGKAVETYFQNLQAQGKQQWFYQCTGPVRLYDPQLYYRYQAWHAYNVGATGQGFWSFSDISKAPSSFSGYATSRINYSPVFFGHGTVYSSVHWNAVREGVEDYETLAMLQDAINTSMDADWKKRAQQTLDSVVHAVTGIWTNTNYSWQQKSKPQLADEQMQKVYRLLKEL